MQFCNSPVFRAAFLLPPPASGIVGREETAGRQTTFIICIASDNRGIQSFLDRL